MEEFLGHRAVRGGGQNGHHLVVGIEQQSVGLGGILHRDLGQGLVGVQGRLHREAAVHPVDQLRCLIQGGTAGGIAVGVRRIRAAHHAEDIGLAVLGGPGDIALGAGVLLVAQHVAHPSLHGRAVELSSAGLVQGHILAGEHKGLGVLFLGGHLEGGRSCDLHKGVKTPSDTAGSNTYPPRW